MLITISYPEVKVGQLRATSYGVSGVVIYDDATNPRQGVWAEGDLEAAEAWMVRAEAFLAACKGSPAAFAAAVDALPASSHGAALKLAKARGLVQS